MTLFFFRILLLVLSFHGILNQVLAGIVGLDSETGFVTLGSELEYLEDKDGKILTLEEVLRKENQDRFIKSEQKTLNLGFTTSSFWVRFDLAQSDKNSAKNWMLEIGFGNFDQIDIYVVPLAPDSGNSIRKATFYKEGGDLHSPVRSDISYGNYAFDLPDLSESASVYIRLSTIFGQATMPMYIWERSAFLKHYEDTGLLWGLYYGLLISVLIYHLSLWFFTNQKGYFLLSAYLFCFLFYELSRGYCLGVRFLWPGSYWFTYHGTTTFFTWTNITFLLFYGYVFDLKKTAPSLGILMYVLIGLLTGSWGVTLLRPDGLSANLVIVVVGIFTSIFLLFSAAYTYFRGARPSLYYFIASVLIFIGGATHSVSRSGIVAYDGFLVRYAMNIGSVLELFFLAVGLASTLRYEKKLKEAEKEKAVTEAEQKGKTTERARVASELHDDVGSSLLLLRQSFLDLNGKKITPEIYDQLLRLLRETYDDVRKISHDLSAREFENRKLPERIKDMVNYLNKSQRQIQFHLLLSGKENEFSNETQFELFLICKELISNIIKHSGATEATIRFEYRAAAHRFIMEIRDNGIGFDHEVPLEQLQSGLGWASILEKAKRLHGKIETAINGEGGTTVMLTIPTKEP